MSLSEYYALDSSRPAQKINVNHLRFDEVNPLVTTDKLYKKDGQLWFNGSSLSVGGGAVTISTQSFLTGLTKDEIEANASGGNISGLIAGGFDESAKLQSLLNDTNGELTKLGITEDAKIKVIVESKKGYIFLNGDIKVPSRCHLVFVSPIVIGRSHSFKVEGSFNELPDVPLSDAPYMTADASFTNTFTINNRGNDISSWVAGDLLAIRDSGESKRYDAVIQSITSNGNGNYTIVTTKTIQEDFFVGDTIKKYEQFRLTQPVKRGDCKLYISNIASTTQGSFIVIKSKYRVGDYQAHTQTHKDTGKMLSYSDNDYKYEVKKVVQKVGSSSYIFIDTPLSNDYSIDECYVIEMTPKQDVIFENLRVMSIEQGTQPRPNNHIIYLNRCADCTVRGMVFTDMDTDINLSRQKPYVDNIIHVRASYGVRVTNCDVTRWNKNDSGSGASYGLTLYYSTNCSIDSCRLSSLRHNILLQSATHCLISGIQVDNPLISGIDLHGINSRDCQFDNIQITCSRDQNSMDPGNAVAGNSTIGCVRVGNDFHTVGDSYNTFRNITITNALPTGDITEVYGLQVIPPSSFNHFNNVRMVNVNKPICLFDHPVHRYGTPNAFGGEDKMVSMNNTFANVSLSECGVSTQLNGARNMKNKYAWQTAETNLSVQSVSVANGITSILVNNSSSMAFYNDSSRYIGTKVKIANANPEFATVTNAYKNANSVIVLEVSTAYTTAPVASAALTLAPYIESVAVVNSETLLTIGNTPLLFWYAYQDFYVGKYISVSGANPQIAQIATQTYNSNKVVFKIAGVYSTQPTVNSTFTVIDRLNANNTDIFASINPVREVRFVNCQFMDNKEVKCCENRFSSNVKYIGNYFFNNHSTNTTSTTNYIQDVEWVGNYTFANNIVDNCKRGFGLSNSSELYITNNQVIKMGGGSNWIQDYLNNSDMVIINNNVYGNNNTNGYYGLEYKLSSTSTHKTNPLYMGYVGTASNYALETASNNYPVAVNGTLCVKANNFSTPFICFESKDTSTPDLGGVGAGYGRIPVTIEGVGTKYLQLYNAP